MTDLLLSDVRGNVQDILAWSICIAALIWGAGPERAVAIVWLLLFEVLNNAYRFTTGASMQVEDIDPFNAMIDSAAMLCWVAIALYANRNYTLWIAAMQVLATTAHLARGLVEAIAPVGYVIMVAVPGWVQLFLLGVGLTRHILRKHKHGEYRDWRVKKPSLESTPSALPVEGEVAWEQSQQPSWRDDLK